MFSLRTTSRNGPAWHSDRRPSKWPHWIPRAARGADLLGNGISPAPYPESANRKRGCRGAHEQPVRTASVHSTDFERLVDPASVSANRAGHLAPEQVVSLRRTARREKLGRIGSLALVLLFPVLGLVIFSQILQASGAAMPTLRIQDFVGPWIVWLIVVVLLILRVVGPFASHLGADIRVGQIDSVTGRAGRLKMYGYPDRNVVLPDHRTRGRCPTGARCQQSRLRRRRR